MVHRLAPLLIGSIKSARWGLPWLGVVSVSVSIAYAMTSCRHGRDACRLMLPRRVLSDRLRLESSRSKRPVRLRRRNTRARSSGVRYRPTMSRTFSTRYGCPNAVDPK